MHSVLGGPVVVTVAVVGAAVVELPPTISVSKQETNISSVYLHTHNHRMDTGPEGMSAGRSTVCGKVWPDFQWSSVFVASQYEWTSSQSDKGLSRKHFSVCASEWGQYWKIASPLWSASSTILVCIAPPAVYVASAAAACEE